MPQVVCPSCDKEIKDDFRFCPNCGYDLQKPIVCPNCEYANESNSNFCQECGIPLRKGLKSGVQKGIKGDTTQSSVSIPPASSNGITIEFPYSSAQSFEFAVEAAKKIHTFQQFGEDKKAIYRIEFLTSEMDSAAEFIEHLKGWRKRTVYVDGEKVTWDSVFSFGWCYERKKASFKPEFYCFGYENEWSFNIWGCIHAGMPFHENAEWFCWGNWLNNKGDWKFNKERIKHELQKRLYQHRFCPSMQPELIDDVIKNLPDTVNPYKDKNWKFVENWGDENLNGLAVTVERFGFKEKVVMKGVCPNGLGSLKEMAKHMKYRLPDIR